MAPSVQLVAWFLLMFSMAEAYELCTNKFFFKDDEKLVCADKCCGASPIYYCCISSVWDDLKKNINNAADSFHTSTSKDSTVTITLSTGSIIGIVIGSIVFIIMVVGFIACIVTCARTPRRPGHVIASNQSGMTVVTAGQTNPVYPGTQQAGCGMVYQPPQVQAYSQPSKP